VEDGLGLQRGREVSQRLTADVDLVERDAVGQAAAIATRQVVDLS
jgi:hypothetical protein